LERAKSGSGLRMTMMAVKRSISGVRAMRSSLRQKSCRWKWGEVRDEVREDEEEEEVMLAEVEPYPAKESSSSIDGGEDVRDDSASWWLLFWWWWCWWFAKSGVLDGWRDDIVAALWRRLFFLS
jgi:hypothetical protein